MRYPPVFDGHNDALTRLYPPGRPPRGNFLARNDTGHLDLPRAREGGFGGGFFSIFVEEGLLSEEDGGLSFLEWRTGLGVTMDPPMDPGRALAGTMEVATRLFRLERESAGALRIVTDADDLVQCLEDGVMAAILHLEGAEALDPELHRLEVFHRAGLRSLGLVWSRPNAFGTGVPFRFPSSPDTGPGLTPNGRRLVRECNRLGILVDLAHLNERGFWDVADLTQAPLVSTHTAAHALCPSARNLTDEQLDAVAESGGVVGVNFFVGDLRADGEMDPETPLTEIVRHVEYLAERMGPEHVAFGSDFDGAVIPEGMEDVTGLPALLEELEEAGFRGQVLEDLCWGNWARVLRESWRPRPAL